VNTYKDNYDEAINKLLRLSDYKVRLTKYKSQLDEMTLYNAANLDEKTSQTNRTCSVVENYITKKDILEKKIKDLDKKIDEIESKLNKLDDVERKLLYIRYVEGNGLKATAYFCNYSYWYTSAKIKASLHKLGELFCDV
jgi:DNA-directed RNA polymerase specialized sigma subunit